MNFMLTIGSATLGFALAYALGAVAAMRIRHAALIRHRLAPVPYTHRRPYLVHSKRRFVGA